MRSFLRITCLLVNLVAAFLMVAAGANAQTVSRSSPAESCLTQAETLTLGTTLPRTAARLKSGGPLSIVAMGSSSTVGLWMRDPAATYPGVMQTELARLAPNLQVAIVNSGRNGDTIPGNIARFDRDVLAHHPDLVVWQVGTNDFTWVETTENLTSKIARGVDLLRASGADVILMDQQYAPVILASRYAKMQSAIADAAQQQHIALFPRFDLMRRSVDAGLSMSALVSWDGLHLSADGYDCVGRALARAIIATAKATR